MNKIIVEQTNCLNCNTLFKVFIRGVQFCCGKCEIAYYDLEGKNYVDKARSN
jgi:hypothetical protein